MSVDSKLFVTCGKDKYIEVVNAVVSQLNFWVRQKLDYHWTVHTGALTRIHFLWNEDYKAQAELFTNGTSISAYNLDMISINFGCGDVNHRSLAVFGGCSSDYSDTYDGDKILFSLGKWGMTDEIMNQVAIAVAPFGDVYYDHSDCDEEGFVLLSQFKGGQ